MLIASFSGRRDSKSGVPFRSENDRLQVLQKAMRISFFFPLQAPQRRFSPLRLP